MDVYDPKLRQQCNYCAHLLFLGYSFPSLIVKVLRDIWFKITQKHQIWHKCSLYHTISISDGRREPCAAPANVSQELKELQYCSIPQF